MDTTTNEPKKSPSPPPSKSSMSMVEKPEKERKRKSDVISDDGASLEIQPTLNCSLDSSSSVLNTTLLLPGSFRLVHSVSVSQSSFL